MAAKAAVVEPTAPARLGEVVALLGGNKVLRTAISTPLDVHEAIVRGFPSDAAVQLIRQVTILGAADVSRALGVSLRTVQRRSKGPAARLSPQQSGRTWKFAEILAKATAVLGDRAEAERWLSNPAMALDQRRPVDLLTSPAGVELVEQLLVRMEYGVYT